MVFSKKITLTMDAREKEALQIVKNIFDTLYELEREGEDFSHFFGAFVEFDDASATIENLLDVVD